jgi:hypothetical protein
MRFAGATIRRHMAANRFAATNAAESTTALEDVEKGSHAGDVHVPRFSCAISERLGPRPSDAR